MYLDIETLQYNSRKGAGTKEKRVPVLNIEYSEGRTFDGSNGNGGLDTDGFSDQWTLTNNLSLCLQGSNYMNDPFPVSSRYLFNSGFGIRGVITRD